MSQYPWEEKKEDAAKLLKAAIESRINELTELNRRLKKKIFDLHTIFELSRKLNSFLDMDSLLENILLTCIHQLEAKGAFISVQSSSEDKSLSFSKSKGIEMPVQWSLSLDSNLANYLAMKIRPLQIKEIIQELKVNPDEFKSGNGLEPEVVAPLVIKDKLRGILLLSEKVSGLPYRDDDLEFLSILVNQVAVAVENTLLYQNEKKVNSELNKTQQQLAQAEKLAALGQLSAVIAHEVNNPLGIIKNYLAILSQSIKKNDECWQHLKVVKEEVDRIARIIKQLLDFYHPKSENKNPTDIGFLLEDTLTFVKEQFSKNKIQIVEKIASDLPMVEAFPDELRQVFLNLLMNSRDSMPKGGKIEVSARLENDKLEIEFKDTGSGIEEKDLHRIFEPFYTTKDKGSGLGLWITNEIIKRHGGEIKVKNREDRKGTCFNLILPAGDLR
ncbi:MAG TPA: ATP-binding protein [Terriglobales bacterium]|nr:ATP-binding protein [Terriglobales bacterium]